MELERFVCDRCGQKHELCKCYKGVQFSKEEYELGDFRKNKKKKYIFPKFLNNDEVEVTEGIIVSKEMYEKCYVD